MSASLQEETSANSNEFKNVEENFNESPGASPLTETGSPTLERTPSDNSIPTPVSANVIPPSINKNVNTPISNTSLNAYENESKNDDEEPIVTNSETSTMPTTTPIPTTTASVPEENSRINGLESANPPNNVSHKPRRSTKQKAADEGQRQMLELLREIYRKEFSDIPEKFRPKPKAYVARKIWYTEEGNARDKVIQSYILADKDAANARMGVNLTRKRLEEKGEFSNDYVLNTLPSVVSSATSSSSLNSFHPSTDTLRERAAKSIERLSEITDNAEMKLMTQIKEPALRSKARYVFKETRKVVKRLGHEIKTQAKHLEHAAKQHIRMEGQKARAKIEKKAQLNLTVALGKKPNKRLTHRLARLRNSGQGVAVKNFLRAEKKAGRVRGPINSSTPENESTLPELKNKTASLLNSYND